ncbi:hypothetical protein AAMO2058_000553500 [Amorphochlora amoebiformis]
MTDEFDSQLNKPLSAGTVIRILEARQSDDYLNLAKDIKFLERLHKFQLKNKELEEESITDLPTVLFSAIVTKVNKSNVHQQRVLLLTKRAVFNLVPGKSFSVKRRIPLTKIESITAAVPPAHDFIVHVKDEYDYHYQSDKRVAFLALLTLACREATASSDLQMQISEPANIHLRSKTKTLANQQKDVVARKRTESHAASSWVRKARKLVRGKKNFVITDTGIELDFTYVTDRIVAMGFPSERLEGLYRNPYSEVYRHLETKHRGHYKVYNLCSERSYAASKFHNRVSCYPFDDHNAPPLNLLVDICEDIQGHLTENKDNIVAVHCKAGKGRTGTIIAAYLVFAGATDSAVDALTFFGYQRTKNSQGVTIPSQRRFVGYFETYLRKYYAPARSFDWKGEPIFVEKLILRTVPSVSRFGVNIYVKIYDVHQEKIFDSRDLESEEEEHNISKLYRPHDRNMEVNIGKIFQAEFLVVISHADTFTGGGERLCWCWLHSSFMVSESVQIKPGKRMLTLRRDQIDNACKDKKFKRFSKDFAIDIVFSVSGTSSNAKSRLVGSSSYQTLPNIHVPEGKVVIGNKRLIKSSGRLRAESTDSKKSTTTWQIKRLRNRGRFVSAYNPTKRRVRVVTRSGSEYERELGIDDTNIRLLAHISISRVKNLELEKDDYPFVKAFLEVNESRNHGRGLQLLGESNPLHLEEDGEDWLGFKCEIFCNIKHTSVFSISNPGVNSKLPPTLRLAIYSLAEPEHTLGVFRLALDPVFIDKTNEIAQWLPFPYLSADEDPFVASDMTANAPARKPANKKLISSYSELSNLSGMSDQKDRDKKSDHNSSSGGSTILIDTRPRPTHGARPSVVVSEKEENLARDSEVCNHTHNDSVMACAASVASSAVLADTKHSPTLVDSKHTYSGPRRTSKPPTAPTESKKRRSVVETTPIGLVTIVFRHAEAESDPKKIFEKSRSLAGLKSPEIAIDN